MRFLRDGLPVKQEEHKLNVSAGHRTSRGWPATAHTTSNISVARPFSFKLCVVPTSQVPGHLKLLQGNAKLAQVVHVEDVIIVNATIKSRSEHPLAIRSTTFQCGYDLSAGQLSELLSLGGGDGISLAAASTVILRKHEQVSRCFMVRAKVSGASQSLGVVQCDWSRPHIANKDVSTIGRQGARAQPLALNSTSVELDPIQVLERDQVKTRISAPSSCVAGKVFEMELAVINHGTTPAPVSFSMQLGSNFLCAGRTQGGFSVQPLSSSRARFRLVGLTPGSVNLPAMVVQFARGQGGDGVPPLVREAECGHIFIYPDTGVKE